MRTYDVKSLSVPVSSLGVEGEAAAAAAAAAAAVVEEPKSEQQQQQPKSEHERQPEKRQRTGDADTLPIRTGRGEESVTVVRYRKAAASSKEMTCIRPQASMRTHTSFLTFAEKPCPVEE
jgi:hypothetical protein